AHGRAYCPSLQNAWVFAQDGPLPPIHRRVAAALRLYHCSSVAAIGGFRALAVVIPGSSPWELFLGRFSLLSGFFFCRFDAHELDIEQQGLIRTDRPAAAAAFPIGEISRDNDLPLRTFRHH